MTYAGIVTNTLGGDLKPVYNTATGNCSSTCPGAYDNGPGGGSTMHGQYWFDMWYRDTPGWNVRYDSIIGLKLINPTLGVYQIANSSFFPLDGPGMATWRYTFVIDI